MTWQWNGHVARSADGALTCRAGLSPEGCRRLPEARATQGTHCKPRVSTQTDGALIPEICGPAIHPVKMVGVTLTGGVGGGFTKIADAMLF